MNTRFALAATALAVIMTAPLAVAHEEEAAEDTGPWSGKASLGYLATSGNTENSTLNTAVEVGYAHGKWQHIAEAFAINASEDDLTTAEAYELRWKSERKLTDVDFLFARAQWRKDLFGAYATQFSQTVGYGRRLIDNNRHKLNAEVGVGFRQSELQDGSDEDETIFRGGAYYKWLLSKTTEFRQNVTVESGAENTYLESVSAISAKLMGDLALVASYTIKHNTDVPIATEKTDTYTALSLEYTF